MPMDSVIWTTKLVSIQFEKTRKWSGVAFTFRVSNALSNSMVLRPAVLHACKIKHITTNIQYLKIYAEDYESKLRQTKLAY